MSSQIQKWNPSGHYWRDGMNLPALRIVNRGWIIENSPWDTLIQEIHQVRYRLKEHHALLALVRIRNMRETDKEGIGGVRGPIRFQKAVHIAKVSNCEIGFSVKEHVGVDKHMSQMLQQTIVYAVTDCFPKQSFCFISRSILQYWIAFITAWMCLGYKTKKGGGGRTMEGQVIVFLLCWHAVGNLIIIVKRLLTCKSSGLH